jgi:hypothetical protein
MRSASADTCADLADWDVVIRRSSDAVAGARMGRESADQTYTEFRLSATHLPLSTACVAILEVPEGSP